MLETARVIGKLPIDGVKIHMLHVMKETKILEQFHTSPFPILSKEEYMNIVIAQLEVLPPHVIIQRLTGDGAKDMLVYPQWTKDKIRILNDIDAEMKKRDTWQGKYYEKQCL